VFEGNAQTIDHVLVGAHMLTRVTRFQYARNNADFPLDYATDFARPERNSDHDMPVAYFALAPADLIFADGFEAGSFAAWSSAATDGGDLSVTPSAAMAGTAFGARALLDDRAALYVQDDSPDNEARYRARFYVDASGFTPPGGARLPVFAAYDDGLTQALVTLRVRYAHGQHTLGAQVRRAGQLPASVNGIPLAAGPHAVELEWRRSSAPGVADGFFQLWIDGVVVGTLDGFDTGAAGVDFVRLGALNVRRGLAGSVALDEFVSHRETYIGP
jgi:hypothetical protein